MLPDDGPRGTETCRSQIKIVAFYVLINSAFVGKIILYSSKCTVKQQLKNILFHFVFILTTCFGQLTHGSMSPRQK
jgi:hypothetical protein